MKHAANRSKATVKAKAKTLSQVKAVKKTQPAAKKPISKIAFNSRKQTRVEKIKAVAKPAPKTSPRAAKPIIKKAAPKLSAKTLNALKSLSARKAEPTIKPAAKPKAKRNVSQISAKTSKVSIKKTKPVTAIKKATTAAPNSAKKIVAPLKAKLKIAAAKPKISAKAPVKTTVKPAKPQLPKIAAQKTKTRQPKIKAAIPAAKIKPAIPAAKIKPARQKSKTTAAAKKPKTVGKTKPIIAVQPAARKKIAAKVPAKRVNLKSKEIQTVAATKKSAGKAEKVKPIGAAKKIVRRTQKFKPAISAAMFGKPSRATKKAVSPEKIKVVTKVIEAVEIPAPKPKNRRARPIGSAVFLGKKERYDFKVFELGEKFEPIPAVYIISKRKIDRNKRGHHALICIGETNSIAAELKRHRKGKCVKKHQANVVSILPEMDEKTRLRIESDLKAAHSVACNFE